MSRRKVGSAEAGAASTVFWTVVWEELWGVGAFGVCAIAVKELVSSREAMALEVTARAASVLWWIDFAVRDVIFAGFLLFNGCWAFASTDESAGALVETRFEGRDSG